jgi:Ser-tRNA(Ala) deacylase AlaX
LKIENDEMEDNTKIEKEYLISALYELKKEREENKSLKIEFMKQKESVQIFEEVPTSHQELKSSTRRSRKTEREDIDISYQGKN